MSGTNSNYAVISSGEYNEITENAQYGFIGGGRGNEVYSAEWSTILGGRSNLVLSRYGTIMGGYENQVRGKMGAVLGGARNTANSKHSMAVGFQAWNYAMVSLVGAFNGDVSGMVGDTNENAFCTLPNTVENSIKFCADSVMVNDVDIMVRLARTRRLADTSDRAAALAERVAVLREEMTSRRAFVFEQMEAQTEVLEAQAKRLRC